MYTTTAKKKYLNLYRQIKKQILNQQLKENEKLPSIRKLSHDLSVSTTTVINAYEQLLSEGYIKSISKSGFYVEKISTGIIKNFKVEEVEITEQNFLNENITSDLFNFNLWGKYLNKSIKDNDQLYSTSKKNGEDLLKQEIIKFSFKHRGVNATKNQVIIGSSTNHLLKVLFNLLPDQKIAFEPKGNLKILANIKSSCNYLELPFKNNLQKIIDNNVSLIYTTPSHQYPNGNILDINSRLVLVNWANHQNSYIIEDDYNSILRYSGSPIPSLQSLSSQSVIYISSFSNLLFPSLKISYMILPIELLKSFEEKKQKYQVTVSKLEQLTLANFMKDGYLEKHLNKIKKIYLKRSNILKQLLQQLNLTVINPLSGTNIIVKNSSIDLFIEAAKKIQINLIKISNDELLFNFRGIKNSDLLATVNDIFKI